jgi:hypothetical protein
VRPSLVRSYDAQLLLISTFSLAKVSPARVRGCPARGLRQPVFAFLHCRWGTLVLHYLPFGGR